MAVRRTVPAGEDARASGAPSLLGRAEVRDVLAWMRLLIDPGDAAAVVRALTRPPIELRQVDLARVIQIARRRKLDLVLGLGAATESPQVPPEARERIARFVELHRSASSDLDEVAPDVFLGRLIELLVARGRPLMAPAEAAEQAASLQRLHELAIEFARSHPDADTRELARHLAAVAPSALREAEARSGAALSDEDLLEGEGHEGEVPGTPGGAGAPEGDPLLRELAQMLGLLREEVLGSVARIGGRLGELRLDTDLDISHGVVRYLELVKVAALLQRADGQALAEALADVNARLLAAATPLQREILQTSTLDDALLAAEPGERQRIGGLGSREERSFGPFLPRRGAGLALSASDIQTYRSCPLRYKFARVLRIPTEQTLHQRFGIVVHQVLERYHGEGGERCEQLLELLESAWRRSALGESPQELELLEKARSALRSYHARLAGQEAVPVWFERQFSFRVGPHHLRGRVDRVDRLEEGGAEAYELIDYKTSRPKTAEQLAEDLQLSLYALAASEDWQLPSSRQAYLYVLDDLKVPVPREERDAESLRAIVMEVGEGILAEAFEPTPSPAACALCDYRITCPAAEA